MWSSWVQGNSNGPLVPMMRLVPIEKRPYSNGSIGEYAFSLKELRLFSHVTWLGTGQFQWSIGTNGKAPYSNGSIGEYAFSLRGLRLFSHVV